MFRITYISRVKNIQSTQRTNTKHYWINWSWLSKCSLFLAKNILQYIPRLLITLVAWQRPFLASNNNDLLYFSEVCCYSCLLCKQYMKSTKILMRVRLWQRCGWSLNSILVFILINWCGETWSVLSNLYLLFLARWWLGLPPLERCGERCVGMHVSVHVSVLTPCEATLL